jgi:hypothetical protein
MGYERSVGSMAAIGCEFSGAYRLIGRNSLEPLLQKDKRRGFLPAMPITTPAKLDRFCHDVGCRYGANHAQRALQFVRAGAESPMETAIYLLFCLPQRYKGIGIPMPDLNPPIEVAAWARGVTSGDSYRCDLFWSKSNLVVEYDSDLCHTGSDRITADAQRRNSLEHLGYRVITVTRQQVGDPDEFLKLSIMVSKHMGINLRIRSKDWKKGYEELWRDLLLRR